MVYWWLTVAYIRYIISMYESIYVCVYLSLSLTCAQHQFYGILCEIIIDVLFSFASSLRTHTNTQSSMGHDRVPAAPWRMKNWRWAFTRTCWPKKLYILNALCILIGKCMRPNYPHAIIEKYRRNRIESNKRTRKPKHLRHGRSRRWDWHDGSMNGPLISVTKVTLRIIYRYSIYEFIIYYTHSYVLRALEDNDLVLMGTRVLGFFVDWPWRHYACDAFTF